MIFIHIFIQFNKCLNIISNKYEHGDLMNYTKILGILSIILGLLFIVYPLLSAGVVSIMAGISLITFGLVVIFNAFSLWSIVTNMSFIEIVMGFLLILFGFLFFVDLSALAFLVSFSFYFIAFILIIIGISGIVYGTGVSRWASVLTLIFGIIFLLLAVFSITDPLIIAILIGACLMVRGVIFFTVGTAFDGINRYENNQ